MGAALVITLREGLEASLIISILLAYLGKLDRRDGFAIVWIGTVLAVATSLAVGGAIFALSGGFEGRAEELFEGTVALVAVSVLTWMTFWMRRRGSRIGSELRERVDEALTVGGFALAGTAFVAVVREGVETALFLFAAGKATSGGLGAGWGQVLGALLGLAAAGAIGFVLYRGSKRLRIRSFFTVTGVLIMVVAAGLLAYAAHELQEAGVFPFLRNTVFDISGSLSDEGGLGGILRALIGFQSAPSVLSLAVWVGYLGTTLFLFFRPAGYAASSPGLRVANGSPRPAPIPIGLLAPGTLRVAFEPLMRAEELPPGTMRRVTRGDLDVLLAHTPTGILALDDRCPHMAAPLSIGELEGQVISCPLHAGRFDLRSGGPVQMPTTGGLDPDGVYHPVRHATGQPGNGTPAKKAEVRRLTRVRRLRYYPVRVVDGMIAAALPSDGMPTQEERR
jgi:high-affinity iron transporter